MKKGFTLIELILYTAIVTIMLSAMVPLSWHIIEGGAKSTTQQEVFSSARYISERIKYEIRRASGISNISAGSISLTNFSPDSTTVIDLNGSNVRINKNGTGAVNLNSSDTSITSLVFTNYTSADNKAKHIRLAMTVTDNYVSNKQEYQQSMTLETSAEVRSNN